MNIKPLNRKESSKILTQISDEYGCDAKEMMINEGPGFARKVHPARINSKPGLTLDLDFLTNGPGPGRRDPGLVSR